MAAVGRSVVDQCGALGFEFLSKGLKRLIAREQNEVIRLLRELRGGIKKGTELAETSDATKHRGKSSGGKTGKTGGGGDDDEMWPRAGNEWGEWKGDGGQC